MRYDFNDQGKTLGELWCEFNVDGTDGRNVKLDSGVTLNLDFNDRPSSFVETPQVIPPCEDVVVHDGIVLSKKSDETWVNQIMYSTRACRIR